MGFPGVQNFPTVGLFDGELRQDLEETGMSYELEVEMIRLAHEKDLLTTPYVFNAAAGRRPWLAPEPTSSSRHMG